MGMGERGEAARRRTRAGGRRWRLPSVAMRDPGEGLERVAVLEECEAELGVLLWRTVRDVELWAITPPARRAALFHADGGGRRVLRMEHAQVPPPLAEPLTALLALLAAPGSADAAEVARCCLHVAAWAGGSRARETALAFAQAAALVLPRDAGAALQTGVCALGAGQRARAEVWLRRAAGLARRARDRGAYARAALALAQLRERAVDARRAARGYRRAYRASRRAGLPEVRLGAARALLRLAAAAGDGKRARRWAVAAQRAYRPGAPDAAVLLELARFWIDAGRGERAVPALRRLAGREPALGAADRLCAAAMRARALAALPDGAARSRAAAADAFSLLGDGGVAARAQLAAAVDLAHAAAARGDGRDFQRAVQQALRAAPAEHTRVRRELAALAHGRFDVPMLQGAH
jgi:hypothetical protein